MEHSISLAGVCVKEVKDKTDGEMESGLLLYKDKDSTSSHGKQASRGLSPSLSLTLKGSYNLLTLSVNQPLGDKPHLRRRFPRFNHLFSNFNWIYPTKNKIAVLYIFSWLTPVSSVLGKISLPQVLCG